MSSVIPLPFQMGGLWQWRSQDFVKGVRSTERHRVLGDHCLRGAQAAPMGLINQCIIKHSYQICAFSDVTLYVTLQVILHHPSFLML